MTGIYDYGGIYDYLEDIHFPRGGSNKYVSKPWFYFLPKQQELAFSFLGGIWGDGWALRDIRSVIKILAVDGQPMVTLPVAGSDSLEAAVDRYVQTWDQNDPRAPEFMGRFNFSDRFFWKVLNREFPKWAQNLATLPTQKPNDGQHRPIATYIDEAVDDYITRWNNSASAYTTQSATISSLGVGAGALMGQGDTSFNVLQQHSFAVPFPPTNLTFKQLAKVISDQKGWFGPIPSEAWFPEFYILTQGYAYVYQVGQLDDNEWDMSRWPPRRTSIPQREGGSGRAPSAISGNYNGIDPFQNFPDHQPPVPG